MVKQMKNEKAFENLVLRLAGSTISSQISYAEDRDTSPLIDRLLAWDRESGDACLNDWSSRDQRGFRNFVSAYVTRVTTLKDFTTYAQPFLVTPKSEDYDLALLPAKKQSLSDAFRSVQILYDALESLEIKSGYGDEKYWDYAALKYSFDKYYVTGNELKPGEFYLPIRYALTAQQESCNGFDCLFTLGEEESQRRLKTVLGLQ